MKWNKEQPMNFIQLHSIIQNAYADHIHGMSTRDCCEMAEFSCEKCKGRFEVIQNIRDMLKEREEILWVDSVEDIK